jgi:hypothetical protein
MSFLCILASILLLSVFYLLLAFDHIKFRKQMHKIEDRIERIEQKLENQIHPCEYGIKQCVQHRLDSLIHNGESSLSSIQEKK